MVNLRHLSDRHLLWEIIDAERRGRDDILFRLYAEEDGRGGQVSLERRIDRVDRLFRLRVPSDHKYEIARRPETRNWIRQFIEADKQTDSSSIGGEGE